MEIVYGLLAWQKYSHAMRMEQTHLPPQERKLLRECSGKIFLAIMFDLEYFSNFAKHCISVCKCVAVL